MYLLLASEIFENIFSSFLKHYNLLFAFSSLYPRMYHKTQGYNFGHLILHSQATIPCMQSTIVHNHMKSPPTIFCFFSFLLRYVLRLITKKIIDK